MEEKILGLEESLEVLRDYPIGADRCVKAALRKASQGLVKDIKGKIPRYKKLVKYKVYGKGIMISKIGLFGNKVSEDRKVSDWFKAYWSNYGTLEGRDPSHRFSEKPGKRKGGIRHRNFFEQSLEGGENFLVQAFNKELANQANKILNVKEK